MANLVNIQTLIDGPRNVVIKLTGVLDTSEVAATGVIGASGFTTTLGSRTVDFVAGALLPTVGQYVTFGDTAATFVAGTYITSVVSATQVIMSTPALKNNAAAAVTITGTAGAVVALDPTFLSPLGGNSGLPANLIIDKVSYNVEAGLAVNLYWEATTNQLIDTLVNSGDDLEFEKFGGLWNNAGTGKTGRIVYNTQGWSGVLSYNVILECRKS